MRTLGDQSRWHLFVAALALKCAVSFSDGAAEEALCNASSQRVFPHGSGRWVELGLFSRWLMVYLHNYLVLKT